MKLSRGWEDTILFFGRKRCTMTVYDSYRRKGQDAFEDGTFLLKCVLTIVNVRSLISGMIQNTIKYGERERERLKIF